MSHVALKVMKAAPGVEAVGRILDVAADDPPAAGHLAPGRRRYLWAQDD
jgi:hypothetical protein